MKILVTGAYGLVGNIVARWLKRDSQHTIVGLDRTDKASERNQVFEDVYDEFHVVDLSDREAFASHLDGVDRVLHFAADPRPDASFEDIERNNILGTYNVFESCLQAKVKRVVCASTIMVSWGYRDLEPIKSMCEDQFPEDRLPLPKLKVTDPVIPTCHYAASKVWAEATGKIYAQQGLSCLFLRLGSIVHGDIPRSIFESAIFCTHNDVARMFEAAMNADENLTHEVFYCISKSCRAFVDMQHAKEVMGYEPLDDADARYDG